MKCLGRLVLLSLSLALLIIDAKAVNIELKKNAQVNSSYILLSDISDIKGNGTLSVFLRDLKIRKSPPLCRSIKVSKEEAARRIYHYLNENRLIGKYKLKLSGAEWCEVERPCTKLNSSFLKGRITEFLNEKLKNKKVVSVYTPSLTIPSGKLKDHIQIKEEGKRFVRIEYTIYLNGSKYKTFWITARVEPLVKTIIAAKDIKKGEIIKADDLKLAKLPERSAKKGFSNVADIVGKIAKVNIPKGTIVKKSSLKPNFLTLRGKPVKIVYSKGNINIELLGVALENGALGDIIKVENLSTRKILLCKVVGKNCVRFVGQ